MIRIYYAPRTAETTDTLIERLLCTRYGLQNPKIRRTEEGKPYLENFPFRFSVTHTKAMFFAAVADFEIGIDAEALERQIDYLPIIKKFSPSERTEIQNTADFLRHWTAKESVLKYFGETLASVFSVEYVKNSVCRKSKLPLIVKHFDFQGHILALCSDEAHKDTETELIPL